MVNEHKSKINNPEAFYRIRYEELEVELKEIQDTRKEMSKKYDKYLEDVERIIERQEKDAPYIKSRKFLIARKNELAKCLQDIDPKWRQRVQYQKEIELQKLRGLNDRIKMNHFRQEEDLEIKRQIEEDIQHTKVDILQSIHKPVYL